MPTTPPAGYNAYKGLNELAVAPTGAGGIARNDNDKELADRVGPVYEHASNKPGANHDSADTAGVGVKFERWSKWRQTDRNLTYICLDATPGAAKWRTLSGVPQAYLYATGTTGSISGGSFQTIPGVTLQRLGDDQELFVDLGGGSFSVPYGHYLATFICIYLLSVGNNERLQFKIHSSLDAEGNQVEKGPLITPGDGVQVKTFHRFIPVPIAGATIVLPEINFMDATTIQFGGSSKYVLRPIALF